MREVWMAVARLGPAERAKVAASSHTVRSVNATPKAAPTTASKVRRR
jgi:hypothetical protein